MEWREICENPHLQNLPFKIEQNRFGQIVMSPAKTRHAILQGQLIKLLQSRIDAGIVFPECPIQTEDGVKVADVVWCSPERQRLIENETVCPVAPEICIEILSDSNTEAEMSEKRRLYLAAGAEEVWLLGMDRRLRYFDASGQCPDSRRLPGLPDSL